MPPMPPNADGTTALHWAVDRDDVAVAQMLVRAGANVKAANRYGVTPMYSAAVNGNASMIAAAHRGRRRRERGSARGRDAAHDRRAHRQGRRGEGAARARRRRQREREVEEPDGAHVGGARRQRRDGEAAPRRGSEGLRSIDVRLDASAVCRAPGPERRHQGTRGRRRRRQREAARRHGRARHGRSGAELRSRQRPARERHRSQRQRAGLDGAASDRVVAASAARPEQSRTEAQRQLEQPRTCQEARGARRRHQRPRDARAELRHGRAQQPEPVRRDLVLPRREVVRRADDAGAARPRRRSVPGKRRR